jgi:copper chaperone CopZ
MRGVRGDDGADTKSVATCDLRVDGMDCASCAAAIERSLSAVTGVKDISVDVVGGRVRVAYAESNEPRITDA